MSVATTPPPTRSATPPPPVTLSRARLRTLVAVCDTLAPGGDGMPSASELGVPEAILDAVARNPRAVERRQFELALSALGSEFGGLLTTGRPQALASMTAARRERALLSSCDSRLGPRRAAFQALRRAALVLYHLLPAEDGADNPSWAAMDYARPQHDAPPRTARRIQPTQIDGVTSLACDVCIVGSGAGGDTAAGVLAAAGHDVVVLEAGGHYEDADFDGNELEGYRRLYANGGAMATADQGVGLLAGACLGGGTTVNFTTSFRTPDHVQREWAAFGLADFAGPEYETSLDAVWTRLGVNADNCVPSRRDELMLRGLDALGWHAAPMPRNVDGCRPEVCGSCA